jgi:CBS-domain-containing membrane protein
MQATVISNWSKRYGAFQFRLVQVPARGLCLERKEHSSAYMGGSKTLQAVADSPLAKEWKITAGFTGE